MRFIGSPKNYLAGLVGLLALAGAGCGGGGGAHFTRSGGTYTATLSLPWAIYDLADTTMASPLRCSDVGAGDLVVTSTNQATNQTFTDVFNCARGTGTTDYLTTGTYTVTVSLYGDPAIYGNNTTLLDQYSGTQTLLSGNNPLSTVPLLINSYVLGWTVTAGGSATSCAAVGVTWVALDIYYSDQTKPTTYFLDCAQGSAATLAIPLGTYDIQWQAFLDDASKRDITLGTDFKSYTVRNSVDPTQQPRMQADLGDVYFAF